LAGGSLVAALVLAGSLALAWLSLPMDPGLVSFGHRTLEVTDRYGKVLLRQVGADDQWRRPVDLDDVSPWVIRATLAIEDRRFFEHCGIDVGAVGRAAIQNIRRGRVVSGASTLTMQLCRMAESRPRSLEAKLIESANALRLERNWSKRDILEAYLNFAPYGGNIRGIEEASRHWLGRSASDLTPAEAALLAGLPQSPSRYRPDRHPERARARQKQVLAAMRDVGCISDRQYQEALNQPIHLATGGGSSPALVAGLYALARKPQGGRTTLDLSLMERIEQITRRHLEDLPAGTGAAVVVIEIASGQIRAMVSAGTEKVGEYLNLAMAPRSPGSALKPFVYAAAMEAGRLSPDSKLWDVPFRQAGWEPGNFDGRFLGEMTAADALRQSRNIPAIHVAREVGLERCLAVLGASGVDLGADAADRAGLSIVTGALEVRLLDLTNAYAALGRKGLWIPANVFPERSERGRQAVSSATARAVNSMLLRRLGGEDSAPRCMSKTGTSSLRRDAWTLGHNGAYAVGVWIGRIEGGGRSQYVGARAAQPLFDEILLIDAMRADLCCPADVMRPVTRAIRRPDADSRGVLIQSPSDGLTLQAVDGESMVVLQASEPDVQWFHNDLRLPPGVARLPLLPGEHQIRCVEARGRWDQARVIVHP
jgi:penicillin-binding protein 1C